MLKILITLTLLLFYSTSHSIITDKEYTSYLHFIRGIAYIKENKMHEARSELQKTIELDKGAVSAYMELIRVDLGLGRTEAAAETADKLNAVSSGPETKLFLGKFYILIEDTEKAKIIYEEIIKNEPENREALFVLSNIYSDSDQQKALSYIEKYISLNPDAKDAYYNRIVLLKKIGSNEETKARLKEAVEKFPDEILFHTALAQVYEQESNIMASADELLKSIELDKGNASLYLTAGSLYISINEYEKAEKVFHEAVNIRKDDPVIYYWIGLIHEQKQDWGNAIEFMEKSAGIKPDVKVYLRLSYYYTKLNYVGKATRVLEKAVKLTKNSPEVYFFLGLGYLDLKDFKNAEKCFNKTIKLDPKYADAYFYLGTIYDRKAKFKKAVSSFRKVIELNPQNASALNYLGYSFAERNVNLDESEELINRAIGLDSENGAYLDSLGWLYFRKGKYGDAKKKLQQALEKLEDPLIYEHLGDVEKKIGNDNSALDYYERAIQLDKNNQNLQKKLEQLRKR